MGTLQCTVRPPSGRTACSGCGSELVSVTTLKDLTEEGSQTYHSNNGVNSDIPAYFFRQNPT